MYPPGIGFNLSRLKREPPTRFVMEKLTINKVANNPNKDVWGTGPETTNSRGPVQYPLSVWSLEKRYFIEEPSRILSLGWGIFKAEKKHQISDLICIPMALIPFFKEMGIFLINECVSTNQSSVMKVLRAMESQHYQLEPGVKHHDRKILSYRTLVDAFEYYTHNRENRKKHTDSITQSKDIWIVYLLEAYELKNTPVQLYIWGEAPAFSLYSEFNLTPILVYEKKSHYSMKGFRITWDGHDIIRVCGGLRLQLGKSLYMGYHPNYYNKLEGIGMVVAFDQVLLICMRPIVSIPVGKKALKLEKFETTFTVIKLTVKKELAFLYTVLEEHIKSLLAQKSKRWYVNGPTKYVQIINLKSMSLLGTELPLHKDLL